MKKTDLSIIILSYNTKQITKDCLDSIIKSLKSSSLNYEVIVIDNVSKDDSVVMLRQYAKKYEFIRLIENGENAGFGRANNQGVKVAKSEYILLLNSDIVVLEDAIYKMYTFYKQNEKRINFLVAKLLNKDMTLQPSSAPFYTLPIFFLALFLRGDYWGATRNSPSELVETDWVSGACIMTKKDYYNKISGFDERVFMYMDEVDLLFRAKKGGMRVFFYPDARFIHLGSASSGGKSYPIIQVFNGLMFFYEKHYSKLEQILLKIMLKLKALIGLTIGQITNNKYLKETYGKAYQMVKMDR